MKAFDFCKNMDCGFVVATDREEAIRLLCDSRPIHDKGSIDYVSCETELKKGVYSVPYEEYGTEQYDKGKT
jgi:hypothetical protein